MPVYEFQCERCGRRFELSRPMAAAGDPGRCPDDGAAARRLFNAGAIHRSAFRDRHPLRLDVGEAELSGSAADGDSAAQG